MPEEEHEMGSDEPELFREMPRKSKGDKPCLPKLNPSYIGTGTVAESLKSMTGAKGNMMTLLLGDLLRAKSRNRGQENS